jgi:hypothetical protein
MSTHYELLPAQRSLFGVPHDLPTDLALYQGGVGSGKTTAGVLLGYLLSRLYPGSRGLVGASTYRLLRDTTRQVWAQMVPPADIARWTVEPDNLVLKNGSEIWFRHLSDPARLASTEFNWIHMEEGSQLGKEVFAVLLARLRYSGFRSISPAVPKRYRLFVTSNPEEQAGWLSETFIEPGTPRENVRYIRAPTAENRFLLARKPDYCETIRQMVDAAYARVYLDGETGRLMSGTVYRSFDPQRHVDLAVRYNPALPLHISLDFNVDFMIALCIQEQPHDETWVVDELVIRDGADTAQLGALILARYGVHASGLILHGDASGYARHHRSSASDYAILRSQLGHLPGFRIKVKPGRNPPVRDRTNAVNFRLCNAKGDERMKIAPVCKALIKSLSKTRFVDGGFEKEKFRDPNDARFEFDHPGDALDYYIADEHPFARDRLSVVRYL